MKLKYLIFSILFTLFFGPKCCNAYKGLFIMTFATKSHVNFYGALTKALAQSGHKITFIGPFQNKLSNENITEIVTSDEHFDKIIGNRFESGFFKKIQAALDHLPDTCFNALTNPKVKKALEEKYDFAIISFTSVECFLPYLYEKQIPYIYTIPNVLINPYAMRIGAVEFLSVHPNKILPLSYPLSFGERIYSVVGDLVLWYISDMIPKRIESVCQERQLCPTTVPPFSELQNQASFFIINSIRALETPVKSTPPTIIYAGGIHIQAPKPLSKDLEDWLTGSGDAGFIYFSLGTAIDTKDITKKDLDIMLRVFRSLDQRILWKWNSEEIENLPQNIKLSPWLPQNDILAHPKIRLFITHGGLLGTQEATYYGVPFVGMPIFADQMCNVQEAVKQGWARQVSWNEVTEEKFRSAVLDMLTNASAINVARQRSRIMRDWPTSPAEEIVFWVEYMVRHKGAKHLQSPFVHMTWYQIYNVDVWFTLVAGLVVVVVLILCLSLFVCKLLRKTFTKFKQD